MPCMHSRMGPRHRAWSPCGRVKRQNSPLVMRRLIGIIICLRQVASLQGPPSEATRKRTAQHVLDLMSDRAFQGTEEVC